MTEIQLFDFEGSEVRVVILDGEPWWVASDVCLEVGLGNVAQALTRVDGDDIISSDVIDSIGRRQQTKLVNESGLYDLVLSSRKPEAKRFRRWITSEVLPTIRKTGGAYIAPGSKAELDLTDPDTALDKLIEIAQVAKAERAKRLELESKFEEEAPYIAAAHEFFDGSGLIGFRESSRALGLRQSDFMTLLRDWGWVELRSTALKAYAIQQGYGKNLVFHHPNGQTINGKLTRKGLERATVRVAKEIG